jgi:REP element-mobilizing transposase RayT
VPRRTRLDAPGVIHHVMMRGIDGARVFRDAADRSSFVDRLARVLVEGGAPCLAWALMPNHVHLVVRSDVGSLSRVMRRLNTGHALWFNRRWNRRGYLFQGRFRSEIVDSDSYLRRVIRYVNRNPLEGGLVASLEELASFPWGGHAGLIGARDPQPFEAVAETLAFFDPEAARARERLLEWMALPDGGGAIRVLAAAVPGELDRPLGTTLTEVSDVLGVDELVTAICAHYRLTREELRSRRRSRLILRARAVLAYWGVMRLGLLGRSVAAVLGITRGGVSAALERGRRMALEDGFAPGSRAGSGSSGRPS